MPDTTCENNNEKHCCISHEFDRAASKAPNKVAVIHALGGSRIARGPRIQTLDSPFEVAGGFLGEGSDSPRPNPRPVSYDGDECFTFSDLLAAVDSLSFRLRRILDGGDDPQLIRPGGDICSKIPLNDQVSESLELCVSNLEHPIDMQNTVIPKILGVYMVPSAEYIIAVLSVLRCGEAFLPLDPSWPKERILSVVSSSNVDLILSCRSLCERNFHQQDNKHWLLGCIHCPVLFISMKEDLQECFLSPEICWPCESRNQRPFCYLMYTSGSTGEAKGVCGTEIGLLNRFFWMQESYPLHGEELLLFKTSISFIDHLQEFLASILTACTLVIPPFIDMKEKPFYVVDFLQLYSINRLVAVPSLIRAILPALESTLIFHIQDSLKLLVLSGETLSLPLWSLLSKLLPKATILNFYGSTEVSGDCTYFDCKRLPFILETESVSSVPIGKSIANCDVVLYGDNDTPDQGEICVDGMCVSGGYIYGSSRMPLDNVKLCSASLYSNSTNECRRQYFRTGDYGRRLQSGDLVFIGRKDRTVKINGHRIALEEIENTLRMHPDIVDAAVIFCECEGEVSVLKAFIVSKQKTGYSENLRSSIRSWMIDRISLAMIPRQLIFMETFPLSSTGKVDYVALAEQASMTPVQDEKRKSESSDLLESIKKDLEFKILWKHELEVPVFGSLSIGPLLGSIICCLVDGHVVALDPKGSIIWKVRTGGPIFAGCCLSHVLPSQVLICSRNGIVYSFQLETGSLLWEYNVGDPITASAYVDENFKFPSPPSHLSDRLVCICTSSGSIYMLRINLCSIASIVNNQARIAVHEFAKLNLEGDIFSSPVMIAGRLFVGCRDDYVHCIGLVPPV